MAKVVPGAKPVSGTSKGILPLHSFHCEWDADAVGACWLWLGWIPGGSCY